MKSSEQTSHQGCMEGDPTKLLGPSPARSRVKAGMMSEWQPSDLRLSRLHVLSEDDFARDGLIIVLARRLL